MSPGWESLGLQFLQMNVCYSSSLKFVSQTCLQRRRRNIKVAVDRGDGTARVLGSKAGFKDLWAVWVFYDFLAMVVDFVMDFLIIVLIFR